MSGALMKVKLGLCLSKLSCSDSLSLMRCVGAPMDLCSLGCIGRASLRSLSTSDAKTPLNSGVAFESLSYRSTLCMACVASIYFNL
jgi:hypothetical protein